MYDFACVCGWLWLLKFGRSSSCRIFGIGPYRLALLALHFLFLHNPFLGFDALDFTNGFFLLLGIDTGHLHRISSRRNHGLRHPNGFSGRPIATQYQIMFFRFGRVGIIDNDASSKADRGGTFTNQDGLFGRFGIKLQDGTGMFAQHGIQTGKKAGQSSFGNLGLAVAITQPLECRNGNTSIKGGIPKRQASSHVL